MANGVKVIFSEKGWEHNKKMKKM